MSVSDGGPQGPSPTTFVGPAEDPDRYELLQLRSRGGEGELWQGQVSVDGRPLPVAVKSIYPSSDGDLAASAARARSQAELLRTLDHPNLIKVREAFSGAPLHALGQARPGEDQLYLVMNWAKGENLVAWVGGHANRDPLTCTRIISRVAAAVAYLHSGKDTGDTPVLHRDLKPSNIVVDDATGDVRLVDYGFVRLAGGDLVTLAGTPAYLAPEVVAGAPPTEASDRFGVGAVAYYLFTGQNPDLAQPANMLTALQSVAGIEDHDGFAAHVMAMLDRDPARRPADLVDWANGLASGAASQRFAPITQVLPPTEERRGHKKLIAAVVAVLIAAAVAAGILATRPKQSKAAAGDVSATVGHDATSASSSSASKPTSTSPTAPATMANFVGQQLDTAQAKLEAEGATVKTVDQLDASVPDGQVVAQDPAAGAPFSDSVTLTVARQPVITYLSDLQPVDGDSGSPNTGVVNISGTPYTRSISTDDIHYTGAQDTYGYDLGRSYTRFKATAGLTDDSSDQAQVKIEVFGDGVELFDQTVTLGHPVQIDVDMTGRLRLTITATELVEVDGDVTAAWGDAQLLSTQSQAANNSTTTTSG